LCHLAHDIITTCYAAACLTSVSVAPWNGLTLDASFPCLIQYHIGEIRVSNMLP